MKGEVWVVALLSDRPGGWCVELVRDVGQSELLSRLMGWMDGSAGC